LYAANYAEVFDKAVIQKMTDAMLKDLIDEGDSSFFYDWMPDKEYDEPNNEKINIGLAHGIPAAMIVLSNMKDIDEKYAKAAIRIGNFIFNHRKKTVKESFYDSILFDRKNAETDSRLGWCYGDLGIALAFWQTGKILQHQDFKNEALRIMEQACKRTDSTSNAVNDCGLCHGSAGVAHIFRRFWWETNNEAFKKAADYWTQQTLDMSKHSEGLAGYRVYRAVGEQKWINDFGLLEGIGGIGLSLLGAIEKEPTRWDQSLIISS
jgi:lantibiotic biosynthesis protein